MEVGQIMMQMSTGTASAVNAPASAEMAALPTGESSDGTFAGMLRGMSPLNSGAAAAVADKATKGITVASDSSGEATTPKPADASTEVMAALLAAIGTLDQMPTVVAAAAEIKPEKPLESAQPDVLMPQDVALLAAGTQIVLSAVDNGRMPESGQKVEPQDKQEKPVESVQPDAMMPQNLALLAAGAQIVLSADGNGKMPESDQKVEPQGDDRNLPIGSVRLADDITMPASATNGFSQMATVTQGQPVELTQSVMTTPKADSMLNGEATKGKINAKVFPEVAATEGSKNLLEKNTPVDSSLASPKGGAEAQAVEVTPVVQGAVEAKSSQLTAATAANGMEASEVPAVQAGRSHEVRPAQADANSHQIAENTPEQLDVPADVRVIRSSAAVHPNPATVVLEAGGKKAESQEDGKLVQLDTATIKKNMEGVSVELAKVSSFSAPEKELLNEGGKDTSDHGTNSQFQQSTMHQQVKADMGTSLGSTSGAGQKDALHSDMSENVFRQVKEVLVNREVKAGSEQITVRLSPEHLGELTLNLKMENQQLRVEIVAANRGVRDALMQHAENLKESLARQNITMESFDVATNGGQRGFEQNNSWNQLAQQQFMTGTSAGGYRHRVPELDVAVVHQYGTQKQYAMVDVHY